MTSPLIPLLFSYNLSSYNPSLLLIGCTTLSQRKDSELELVTGCTDGRIYFWDCDIDEAVMAIQDPSGQRLFAAEISPSVREVSKPPI